MRRHRPSRPTKSVGIDHPHASTSASTKYPWVHEHTMVAVKALGRALPKGACVHHVDENPRNNAPSNLVICQDNAYHKLLHVRATVRRCGGDPNTQRVCSKCSLLLPMAAFNRLASNKSDGLQRWCRACQSAYCKGYRWPCVKP